MDMTSPFPPKICTMICIIIITVQGRTIPHVPTPSPHTIEDTTFSETTKAKTLIKDSDESGRDIIEGCMILTPEQKAWLEENNDEIIHSIHDTERMLSSRGHGEEHDTSHRRKRKISNIPNERWRKFPIIYKFDGKHTASQQTFIRNAIAHWMAQTCVTFKEVDYNASVSDNHILFTKSDIGTYCTSYIGNVIFNPQDITLDNTCFGELGLPVHEIGHALGLWHEHQRFDRDDYIRINWEAVGSNWNYWFLVSDETESLGVSYDYASVMHYNTRSTSTTGEKIIEALDPLYDSTMGQRTGLSFKDAQIINRAYCSDVCRTPLPRQCANNGYQDPLQCDSCRCPDGLSGRYCEDLAPPVKALCGGYIQLDPSSATTISSPGYEQPGRYDDRVECNWLVRAPPGYHVRLSFIEEFRVYCQYACSHWVEVRYAGSIGEQGPRFCCYDRPQEQLVSLYEEMLIVFRSNSTAVTTFARRGFKARLEAVGSGNGARTTTTTSTSTITTTTIPPPSTTATTTTTTTTTTPTTTHIPATSSTTTPIVSTTRSYGNIFHWSCGFEDRWAGMEQSKQDQFDWTLWTGPTPSDETGPDGAYSGRYYAYIEASDPRSSGDQAVLWLPDFQLQGSYCLKFHYHMFGFHINELRLQKVSENENTAILWQKQKQQGRFWLEGRVQLILHTTDRVGFVGIRGDEFSGDIALDAVEMAEGYC